MLTKIKKMSFTRYSEDDAKANNSYEQLSPGANLRHCFYFKSTKQLCHR